jgi:hypothetical protein
MTSSPFSSESQFRATYRDKLAAMLHANPNARDFGLSIFILVCANAYFDRDILSEMDTDLRKAYINIRERYFRLFADGQIVNERYAEDLLVFLKISLVGLEQLRVTEQRQMGEWTLQFNHIRSFRPQRTAARAVVSMTSPSMKMLFTMTRPFATGRVSGPVRWRVKMWRCSTTNIHLPACMPFCCQSRRKNNTST